MFALSYALSGSIVLTVFLLQWWQRPAYPIFLWIGLGCVVLISLIFLRTRRSFSVIIIGSTCMMFLALLRVGATYPSPELTDLLTSINNTKNMTLFGRIAEDPDIRKDRINYTLELDGIETASGDILSATGRVLITDMTQWPIHLRGSIVQAKGLISAPEDGYGDYLSVHNITHTLRTFSIAPIGNDPPLRFWLALFAARRQFSHAIQRAFPEPSASLLDGLLTGSRSGLSEELNDVFKRTGLTHIIAVSGSNITIVLSMISGMLFFLPFAWRLVPSMIAITLFTLFVGAEASVVRACVMGIIGLIALHTGRTKTTRLTILWAAAFMLLWNPRALWYDAGFQLSFLAVIGLTEFQPLLKHTLDRLPLPSSIRDALLTTIAAQITAMPWVVYKFDVLSLVSPLANVLVAPFIPIAMFVGFAGVVLHMISPPIGLLISGIGHIVLSIIVRIALISNALPYAAITLKTIGPFLVWFYYAALISFLSVMYLQSRRYSIRTNENRTP